jgi:cell division septation protein DedD
VRDLGRAKDKIEIRLEPRQVVLLGVLTTAFSGGLFAAGYLVGARHAAPPSSIPDLAAIDAAARAPRAEPRPAAAPVALGDVEFMFPSELAAARAARPAPAPASVAEARKPAEPAKAPEEPHKVAAEPAKATEEPHKAAAEPAKATEEPHKAAEVARAADEEPHKTAEPDKAPDEPRKLPGLVLAAPHSAAAPRSEAVAPKPVAEPPKPAVEAPRPVADAPKPAASASVAAAPTAQAPKPPDEEDAPAAHAEPEKPAATGAFTLQVKAVQDKAEADAFMASLRKSGFEPHLILADVPGKGRWYRIRVGRFATMDEAREFQRKFKAKSGLPDGGFVTDL